MDEFASGQCTLFICQMGKGPHYASEMIEIIIYMFDILHLCIPQKKWKWIHVCQIIDTCWTLFLVFLTFINRVVSFILAEIQLKLFIDNSLLCHRNKWSHMDNVSQCASKVSWFSISELDREVSNEDPPQPNIFYCDNFKQENNQDIIII